MLSAQFKAGKSTLVGNLMRALADREPFLDQFDVRHPPRRIALIDTELDNNTLRRWLRDQNIRNHSAVVDVVALRGRVAAFNLIDDRIRAQWAERLRQLECDYLILDCLRPSWTLSVSMSTAMPAGSSSHSTRYSPRPASTMHSWSNTWATATNGPAATAASRTGPTRSGA